MIFKLTLVNGGWGISYVIAFRWMPLDLADDKSTLIQVMAWCRQATSHYLSQWWPRSLSPYGVIRPQWVKQVPGFHHAQFQLTTPSPCQEMVENKNISFFISSKQLCTQWIKLTVWYPEKETKPTTIPLWDIWHNNCPDRHVQQLVSNYPLLGIIISYSFTSAASWCHFIKLSSEKSDYSYVNGLHN